MRAVLSVWDKTSLVEFGQGLAALGWEIVSTGRTHDTLAAAGVPVRSVSDLIGFPEILDGRVKTLHPRLHAGILARRDVPSHLAQLAEHGISTIDLVAVNLYPFVETIGAQPLSPGALAANDAIPDAVRGAVEQIDIGGPAMVRAAAKNFEHVVVVVDPADYPDVLQALRAGGLSRAQRARLAQKAFEHTARYDAYVAQYFASANGIDFADSVSLPLTHGVSLSYGENPHQQAAFYRFGDPHLAGPSLADLEQLHGDALSYNNLLDLDNAYAIVAEFDEPAVAIVKHNNPCGVGVGETITEAYRKAFFGDPLSAHGGVVAANRPIGGPMAEAMGISMPTGALYWVVVAPDYTDRALRIFDRRQTRVCRLPVPVRPPAESLLPGFRLHYRAVTGGFLAQTPDAVPLSRVTFTTVSRRPPTERELADLRFAWRIVKHVRSNASVFARNGAVVASGAGQMSRVDTVHLAARIAARSAAILREKLGEHAPVPSTGPAASGCAMATDGFFPFPDAVEAAAEAGVTAIAHPGGAKQDADATAAADRHGMAMVVTGYRHFRH